MLGEIISVKCSINLINIAQKLVLSKLKPIKR